METFRFVPASGGRAKKPSINQPTEEDFVDLTFKLVAWKEMPDKTVEFEIKGTYKGEAVGLKAVLKSNLVPGIKNGSEIAKGAAVKEGLTFVSSGSESDRLISALAELYGAKKKIKMVPEFKFTIFPLEEGPIDFAKRSIRLKLFGNDEGTDQELEEKYFESFFNIDKPNGIVQWNEKDSEYRAPLINSLGKR